MEARSADGKAFLRESLPSLLILPLLFSIALSLSISRSRNKVFLPRVGGTASAVCVIQLARFGGCEVGDDHRSGRQRSSGLLHRDIHI